jgi:hypothetical protein
MLLFFTRQHFPHGIPVNVCNAAQYVNLMRLIYRYHPLIHILQLEIIKKYAPRSWTVVPSQFEKITAHECDMELSAYESLFPGAWKIVLTTTEYVVHPNLRKYLAEAQGRNISVVRFPCMRINGDETKVLKRFDSLVKQRNHFAVS